MINVLVPSRGRPLRAEAMARSAIETAVDVRVTLIVDADDPELHWYRGIVHEYQADGSHALILRVLEERVGYTGSLNQVSEEILEDLTDRTDILGAFGDDVLFRTAGWDLSVREILSTPGIAYGDDLIHGKNHPSAVFISREIVEALGWLALPATSHQWADDGWKSLGQRAGILRFMPGVILEHMHPAVEKAEWDETYKSVFDSARAESDYNGFKGWLEGGGIEEDLEKLRPALG